VGWCRLDRRHGRRTIDRNGESPAYTALKGPFAAHHITCTTYAACEIDVSPISGKSNDEQVVTANLDVG
jgi:hypothetical protein